MFSHPHLLLSCWRRLLCFEVHKTAISPEAGRACASERMSASVRRPQTHISTHVRFNCYTTDVCSTYLLHHYSFSHSLSLSMFPPRCDKMHLKWINASLYNSLLGFHSAVLTYTFWLCFLLSAQSQKSSTHFSVEEELPWRWGAERKCVRIDKALQWLEHGDILRNVSGV